LTVTEISQAEGSSIEFGHNSTPLHVLAEYAKISCIDPGVELLRGFGALVDRAHSCLILTRVFIVSVIVVVFGATCRVRRENQFLKPTRGV
jgi:hypothetical protein